ncbi:MAG: YeeE/YedE family protein [Rhodobacteraceae bacterium]|nr:YeeE/YedE family protein [Paracoccaceae bacterium]
MDALADTTLVALVGLFGGVLLGLAARLGRFCTLGAIEDLLYGGSDTRLRMWLVALGIAIIGSFGLMATGLLDPAQTFYLTTGFSPIASIAGGLLFGYGMALAGNCGYGALARLGGGDLRSFVIVIVMALAAAMTIGGPLAYLRVWIFPMDAELPPRGLADILAGATGIGRTIWGLAAGLACLAVAFRSAEFRRRRSPVIWAVVAGLAIVSGWAGTQWVSDYSFGATRVVSHTYSGPLSDTVLYAMTASGSTLSFGVGSVLGVLAGAFIGSLIRGHFRWEACDDPRELRRQIIGAAMMGVGAVVAAGCSVGQGLSAFSLLAVSAPVTLAAIGVGAALGLKFLILGIRPAP